MNGLCGKRNCDICIYKNSCGGCSLCEFMLCNKRCKCCPNLCPSRPQVVSCINRIGGTELQLKGNGDIDITAHIPILPDHLSASIDYSIMPIVGVHAGNMFSKNGEKISKIYVKNGFRKVLNIDDRCEGILEFYIKDRTLEGFWDNRKNIYKDLKKIGFKLLIAPNFSVYEDTPRIEHLYNMKRSAIVYNEMLEQGMNAAPDISWYGINDLERWCNEINKSKCKVISFSFQVVDVRLKASSTWKLYITGFRYLCQNISPKVKVIIAGISSARRIEEIHKAASGQKVYVLNQSAYIQSRRGMISENRIRDIRTPINLILERNICYFNKIYNEMNYLYAESGVISCQNQEPTA